MQLARSEGISTASLTRQHKLIPIRILENRRRSPWLLLWLNRKLHSLGLERRGGRKHVIGPECDRLKSADAVFEPVAGKQNDLRFGARNAQFDPALLSKRLVGHHAEAKLFGVELQSAILIASGNASELDATNHSQSPSRVVRPFEHRKARVQMQSPIYCYICSRYSKIVGR
jgi:hypothetical protein